MNIKFIRWSVCAAFLTSISYAQEIDTLKVNQLNEVVVSDTKFEQKREKSGKIIDVISTKDLEARKGQSVAQVLNQVAGLEVNGSNSSAGKNLEYYIRGGRSRQVLIIIDGNPVNDATSIASTYDLRLLPVEQIEKIEILKGSSSVLYGSGAATGVISITTKKAKKDKLSGNAYFNIGTQNTVEKTNLNGQEFNQGFGVNGNIGKLSFNTTLNSTEVDGFSQATGDNFERDYFSRINLNQQLGYKYSEKLKLDAFINYDKLISENDLGAFQDSDVDKYDAEQVRVGFRPNYKYNKGEAYLNVAFANLERNYDSYSSWAMTTDETYYKSRTINADLVNKLDLFKGFHLITGVQSQFMDMFQTGALGEVDNKITKFNVVDPYFTAVYNSDFGLNVNAGARLNIHSKYGSNLVYNVNPSFYLEKYKLRVLSSFSTAYITPTLYQLYSQYGNLELKPEENATAEVGFEKSFLNNKIVLNAVGFYRVEENKMNFISLSAAPWGQYQNVENKINAKGIETNVTYSPIEKIKVTANYTFTEVENEDKLLQLIPKHKFNAGVDVAITNKLKWSAQYQYTNQKIDLFYNSAISATQKIDLDSYQIVNSNISYKLNNYTSFFAGVTNLLDVEFVEKIGYSTRGRNFKLGVNLQF
ncbi:MULTISPECIES: TonB-dependent receptor plug domain-containing protein [Flavobacterium]|uniref:TonB-dependent receptor plug domain-containing protein n=1 Tax=Flavobacterium jumunjinense TaxID=998845 RepID=A0ABV5GSI2_9FLAO|nr:MULTISPECIES: TonB-dependent receptor [Flavobacterium]